MLSIFQHIPKCGGTSYTAIVKDKSRFFNKCYFVTSRDERDSLRYDLSRAERAACDCITGHVFFGIHQSFPSTSYQYVTMVRHPVDRVVSEYYFQKRINSRFSSLAKALPLLDFVAKADCWMMDNCLTRFISGEFPPVGRCRPWMLEKAKDNVAANYAVIGCLERHDLFTARLCAHFQWEQIQLGHCNRGVNKETAALSQAAQATIAEKNWLDMALYDSIASQDSL